LTGERLPATLLFNYPSPAALADYLSNKLAPAVAPVSVLDEIDRLAQLDAAGLDAAATELLTQRLQALLIKWRMPLSLDMNVVQPTAADEDERVFDGADDEQLMRLVDESIGQQGLGHGNG
jgi:hypothetical protein